MALGAKAAGVTPFFKTISFEDGRKTMEAGRPIFTDLEVVEIRFAGSKDCTVQPVHQFSHWEVDEDTGEQRALTYAERWPKQYRQFKEKQAQTKSGTPLDYAPFLVPAKRSELRALNIYTVEALAELDGQPLKLLGIGGRELKNKAIEYLASASHDGVIMRQQAQIDALLTEIRSMKEEKLMQLAGPMEPPGPGPAPVRPPPDEEESEDNEEEDGEGQVLPGPNVAAELVGMTRPQLRAYITEKTGKPPLGNPSTGTLLRVAQEIGR